MRRLLGAWVLGILVTACAQGGPGDTSGREPGPRRPDVEEPRKPPALSVTTDAIAQPAGTSRVGDVQQVVLEVKVVGAEGPRELSVEFFTPKGDLYERRTRMLSGTAFDTQAVLLELPVAGTMVDSSNLVGIWQARVFVDGKLLGTRSFELAP